MDHPAPTARLPSSRDLFPVAPGNTAHPSPFRAEHVPAAPEAAKRQRPRPPAERTHKDEQLAGPSPESRKDAKEAARGAVARITERRGVAKHHGRRGSAPDDEKTRHRPGWRKVPAVQNQKKPLRSHATRGPETQRIRLRFARSTFLPRLKRRRGSAPAARGKDAQRRAVRGAAARIAEKRKRSSPWGRRSDRGKTRQRQHHGRRGIAPPRMTKRRSVAPDRGKPGRPGSKKSPCERTRREARKHSASVSVSRGARFCRARNGEEAAPRPPAERTHKDEQSVGPPLGSRKDAKEAARGAAARIAKRRSVAPDRGKPRPVQDQKKASATITRREARFGKRRQASSTMTRGEAPDGAGKCSSRPKSSCAGRESCLLCISSSTANS